MLPRKISQPPPTRQQDWAVPVFLTSKTPFATEEAQPAAAHSSTTLGWPSFLDKQKAEFVRASSRKYTELRITERPRDVWVLAKQHDASCVVLFRLLANKPPLD